MPPKAMLKGQIPSEVVLKVIGNQFVPEMRTVCALLDLNEIPYQCEIIDIFSNDGRQDYKGFNPSQTMPTLIEGF
jgi:glutathione S-transferase